MKQHIWPHGLTFHWPDPRQVSFLLPGFFLLSIILHALTFYVFQVVYPPYVSITPPPTQVSLLMPDSVENLATLSWIEAEDPAALLIAHELDTEKLLNIPYRPSYSDNRPLPQPAAEGKMPIPYPAALDALSMIKSAVPRMEPPGSPKQMPDTAIRFSGPLENRKIADSQPFKIGAGSAATLDPARFLIGVTESGEVRYIFLQNSSGDKSMDALAEAHLRALRFAPDSPEIAWGFVSFLWGSDAFASPESHASTGQKSNDPR